MSWPGLRWRFTDEASLTTMKFPHSLKSRAAWCVVLLAIGFSCFVRLRLLSLPLERDEGEFAYPAQLLLEGIFPYKMAYSMLKMPGLILAYVAIVSIFGQTIEGIHLGLLLVNTATLILLFLIVRRLFDPIAGAVATMTLALLSVGQSVRGTAAHATHFVMLPALGGFLLLLVAVENGGGAAFYFSGLLFGTAFIVRQPALFFVLFGLLVIWRNEMRLSYENRRAAKRTLLFCLGAAMPFALICIAMSMGGVFRRFWFWTFIYVRQYGSEIPFALAWPMFQKHVVAVMQPNLSVWLIGSMGLICIGLHKSTRRYVFTAVSFFVCSFLTVCPGFHFRSHYFVQLLPALALFTGVAVSTATDFLRNKNISFVLAGTPVIIFAATWMTSVLWQREFLFVQSPVQACRTTYGPNPFPESIPIANYIAAHTTSKERIAVIGSEPQIYFYAHRHCATGYIVIYPLMDPNPIALQMQQAMISEIIESNPKYLVLVNVRESWFPRANSVNTIAHWAEQFCRTNYKIVGVADIISTNQTVYRWDEEAAHYQPRSRAFLTVWKLKG
jgi:hypothetical protein